MTGYSTATPDTQENSQTQVATHEVPDGASTMAGNGLR